MRASDPLQAEPPVPATGGALEARERDLTDIESRLGSLRRDLAGRESDRDALYAELEQYERDIAALSLAGRQLDAMVREQEAAIATLDKRLAAARDALAAARAALVNLLRSAYAMGRGDRLRLLLNQEDPARVGRVFGYYRAIGRERAAQVAEVDRLSKQLAELSRQGRHEAERLTRLAAHQRETRERLETARAGRAKIAKDLDATIADDRERIALLAVDAEALRALIEQLRRQAEIEPEAALSQQDITARQGQLVWPVSPTRLLQGFRGGADPGNLHADGVLLAAEPGCEVHAVHHGRVVYADWLRGFGLLLVIDHGDGYMTLYGHNETLLKEVGEWVSAGDAVALAGASGGGGGGGEDAGLYFAIRRHTEPLDPAQWCSASRG